MSRPIHGIVVVRRTFEIYGSHASLLLPVSILVVAVVGALNVLGAALPRILAILVGVAGLSAVALFVGLIVVLVADVHNGALELSVGRRLQAVKPVLGKLILVGFVASICIAVCLSFGFFILLALAFGSVSAVGGAAGVTAGSVIAVLLGFVLFLAPVWFLLTRWSVAAPIIVLERPAGLGALGRSGDLLWGNSWRVFGIVLLLSLFFGVGGHVIDLAAAGLAGIDARHIVQVVFDILVAPIPIVFSTVLYFELRDASALAEIPASSTLPDPAG